MPRDNERRDPNELGALWERETRKGDKMLSGEVVCPGCGVSHDIVGLSIGSRNPKAPTWRLMKSTNDGRGGGGRGGGDRGRDDDRYPSERGGDSRRYEGRDDDRGRDRGRGYDDRDDRGRGAPRDSPRYDDRDRDRGRPAEDWTRDSDRGGRGRGGSDI